MNLRKWIIGAINAAVFGAAGGVLVVIMDPKAFNFSEGLNRLAATSAAFAIVAVAGYVQKHPIAPEDPS